MALVMRPVMENVLTIAPSRVEGRIGKKRDEKAMCPFVPFAIRHLAAWKMIFLSPHHSPENFPAAMPADGRTVGAPGKAGAARLS
ncbi:hypothetical protein U5A82_10835 [Sphingobium sp. CR2-8]|uniref:hypothetical protein n=1 Tax=Sphingobium sp. CR2-8 TaxID=1306534 RepID=UPI002DC03DD0|nr:hypothetical protein [Sphingobium sp. CR2-8]MEC3910948.1 hypothetical protein [Sphingobium sp. CR2-8]